MYKKLCWFRLAILTFIFMNALACGQKGPLYLPETSSEPSDEVMSEQQQNKDAASSTSAEP